MLVCKMSKKTSPPSPRVSPASSDREMVQEFQARAKEYQRLYMSTPEEARQTLHRIGILTKSGNLAKPYR